MTFPDASKGLIFISILLILTSIISVQKTIGQICDPEIIKHRINGPEGYSPRNDNRCEGFFSEPYSAPNLAIVSYQLGLPSFKTDSNVVLQVRLPKIQKLSSDKKLAEYQREQIRIRATPFSEVNYLMDAVVVPDSTLEWPLKILASKKGRIPETNYLGLYGKFKYGSDNIIVPIKLIMINPVISSSNDDSLRIVIRSCCELFSVRWRIYENNNPAPNYQVLNTNRILGSKLAIIPVPFRDKTATMRMDFEATYRMGDKEFITIDFIIPSRLEFSKW